MQLDRAFMIATLLRRMARRRRRTPRASLRLPRPDSCKRSAGRRRDPTWHVSLPQSAARRRPVNRDGVGIVARATRRRASESSLDQRQFPTTSSRRPAMTDGGRRRASRRSLWRCARSARRWSPILILRAFKLDEKLRDLGAWVSCAVGSREMAGYGIPSGLGRFSPPAGCWAAAPGRRATRGGCSGGQSRLLRDFGRQVSQRQGPRSRRQPERSHQRGSTIIWAVPSFQEAAPEVIVPQA